MAKKKTAKKTAGKPKATKTVAPSPDDLSKAAVVKALTRAAASVEKSMTVKKVSLDPGSYPVALNLDIDGELLVEAPVAGTPAGPSTTVVDVTPIDLLFAMMAGRTQSVIEQHVERGLAFVRQARSGKEADKAAAQAQIDEAEAVLTALLEAGAKRRRMTRVQESPGRPGRAGAVKGLPGVAVNGTIGEREVKVEVDGGAG